jgi:acyl-CoA dehydrogenase
MQSLFEDTLSRLLDDHLVAEIINGCEQGGWPATLWTQIEALGFGEAAASERAGGSGASWHELYPVVRACGYHNLPAPLPETMLVNWLIGLCGARVVTGPASLAAGLNLSFTETGVSGCLHDVPFGRHVSYVLGTIPSSPSTHTPSAPWLTLLRVADAREIRQRSNLAGEPRDTFEFVDCTPVVSCELPPGCAENIILAGGAMLRSAQIAGALERCLDMVVRYAGERVQFGRPISKFQAVQQQIAVLAEEAAASRIAAEVAFATVSDSGPAPLPVMSASIRTSEAVETGAAIAHALFGAIGFTHEHSLHLSTRRMWAWDGEFGSARHWADEVGRRVCRLGPRKLWSVIVSGQF